MSVKPNRVGRPKLGATSVEAERVILDAALELFAARSFSAVTIKVISEATGYNAALIYYYFNSKDDLFLRAVSVSVERAFEEFSKSRKGIDEPRKVIDLWIDTHVRSYDTIEKLIKISVDYARSNDRKSRIDQAIQKFYSDERNVLRNALRDGIARGEFGPIDVDETATFISTYLDGVFVRAIMLREFDAIAAIRELKTFLKVRLARPSRLKARR